MWGEGWIVHCSTVWLIETRGYYREGKKSFFKWTCSSSVLDGLPVSCQDFAYLFDIFFDLKALGVQVMCFTDPYWK